MGEIRKYTSENLMRDMGLQFGDKIKINNKDDIYVVELNEYCEPIYRELYTQIKFPLADLVNRNYEILPRPKRVGDTICEGIDCADCPLLTINCLEYTDVNESWFERLERWYEKFHDEDIYKILKARLDKEVE